MRVEGYLKASKPLDAQSAALLNKLSDTPRYARDVELVGTGFGVEGEFYTQDSVTGVIEPIRPPVSQPSMELDWYVTDDGTEVHYKEEMESPVHAVKWMHYLIMRFFQQKGIALTGDVKFYNSQNGTLDFTIRVVSNKVDVV